MLPGRTHTNVEVSAPCWNGIEIEIEIEVVADVRRAAPARHPLAVRRAPQLAEVLELRREVVGAQPDDRLKLRAGRERRAMPSSGDRLHRPDRHRLAQPVPDRLAELLRRLSVLLDQRPELVDEDGVRRRQAAFHCSPALSAGAVRGPGRTVQLTRGGLGGVGAMREEVRPARRRPDTVTGMDINRVPILAPAAATVFPVEMPVVALVASTGGLDALTRVLAPLPAELPAAVLIARHQDPTRASQLAGFLDDRTALAVRAVRDGDRLEIGQVLVTPPAAHLIVTAAGVLGLIDTGALPPARPSADLLLATLAVTAGPRVLAVVLSGSGTDAQAGIRAVNRCGGTVLAQDESSAQHFGMPSAAIATGLVHAVHPLDEMAAAIVEHLHGRGHGIPGVVGQSPSIE